MLLLSSEPFLLLRRRVQVSPPESKFPHQTLKILSEMWCDFFVKSIWWCMINYLLFHFNIHGLQIFDSFLKCRVHSHWLEVIWIVSEHSSSCPPCQSLHKFIWIKGILKMKRLIANRFKTVIFLILAYLHVWLASMHYWSKFSILILIFWLKKKKEEVYFNNVNH